MIAGGPSSYASTCKPEEVLRNYQNQQQNFYCSDVQVRCYYPSYAKALWKQFNTTVEMEDGDAELLRKGHVDFYSYSYYQTRLTCLEKDDNGNGTLARSRKDSFYWIQKAYKSNGEDLD